MGHCVDGVNEATKTIIGRRQLADIHWPLGEAIGLSQAGKDEAAPRGEAPLSGRHNDDAGAASFSQLR